MSYCRWGENGSDVYVFGTGTGYVCMGCKFTKAKGDPAYDTTFFHTRAGMLAHLYAHRAASDMVPEKALERLRREEAEENDPRT